MSSRDIQRGNNVLLWKHLLDISTSRCLGPSASFWYGIYVADFHSVCQEFIEFRGIAFLLGEESLEHGHKASVLHLFNDICWPALKLVERRKVNLNEHTQSHYGMLLSC